MASQRDDILEELRRTTFGPQFGGLDSAMKAVAQKDYGWADAAMKATGGTSSNESSGFGAGVLDVLDFIARPQRAVTGLLAGATGPEASLMNALSAGWKGLAGTEKRDFDEFLNNVGWQNQQGKFDAHDVVSFLGNVAFDPLTYLTLGAGSAVKAGKAAASSTAKGVAEKYSMAAAKNPFETASKVSDAYRTKYAGSAADPHLIDEFAQGLERDIGKQIDDAARAARADNQNNLINFDIPFTNITKGFGELPSFMKKSDGPIGELGGSSARTLLTQLGLKESDQTRFLRERYGVDSTERLSMQAFEDLQSLRGMPDDSRYTPRAPDTQQIMRDTSQLFEGHVLPTEHVRGSIQGAAALPQGALSLPQSALGSVDSLVSQGRGAGRYIPERNVLDADFDNIVTGGLSPRDAVADMLQSNGGKFVQDMGGTRPVEKLNPFKYSDARTFRTGDALIDNAASRIQDTNNNVYGNMHQMEKDVESVGKKITKLTENEQRSLIYLIEDTFPVDAPIKKGALSDNVRGIAEEMKTMLQGIEQREVRAGVLSQIRENYFPHVLKRTSEELSSLRQKYADDPEMKQLLGRSQGNRFNQERTSFETIAQAENYITGLNQKLNKLAPGTNEYDTLVEKIDVVQNLFETDPTKALAQRYYTSVRSIAMKDLYDQFKKDGVIVQGKRGTLEFETRASEVKNLKGMQKLDAETIKQLGLRSDKTEDVYMHKVVLDGLRRVEGIFTDKGADKVLKTLDEAVGIWKTLVTTAVPSHYWNNFIGNIANMTLAGADVRSLKRSAEILRSNSDPDLLKEAVDAGVLNQGFTSDFTRNALQFNDTPSKLSKVADAVGNNKIVKGMRHVGEAMDNWTRLALYIDAKDRTGSAKLAAQEVRKYLFNYREMTNTDRVMRAAMPFWNWTKNNLPLQLEKLLTTPRFYATYDKLKRDMFSDDQPDYIREDYIPGHGDRAIPARLPMGDIDQALNPVKAIGSSLNPIPKSLAELQLNKQFYTDKPINWDDIMNPAWGSPASLEYLKRQTGIIGKGIDVLRGDMNPFDLLFGKSRDLR